MIDIGYKHTWPEIRDFFMRRPKLRRMLTREQFENLKSKAYRPDGEGALSNSEKQHLSSFIAGWKWAQNGIPKHELY